MHIVFYTTSGVCILGNLSFGLRDSDPITVFGLKTVFNWNLFVILKIRSVIHCTYGSNCIPFLSSSLFLSSLIMVVYFFFPSFINALLMFLLMSIRYF